MATNDPTLSTRYFWPVTFQWPVHNGIKTATVVGAFNTSGPVSRTETFARIRQGLVKNGVPQDADVLFLTIEPDLVTGPAA